MLSEPVLNEVTNFEVEGFFLPRVHPAAISQMAILI